MCLSVVTPITYLIIPAFSCNRVCLFLLVFLVRKTFAATLCCHVWVCISVMVLDSYDAFGILFFFLGDFGTKIVNMLSELNFTEF